MIDGTSRKISTRIIASVLAACWLGAGLFLLVVGFAGGRWLLALVSIAAIWYGCLWIRVAREGHQLRGPGAWIPWRRSSTVR